LALGSCVVRQSIMAGVRRGEESPHGGQKTERDKKMQG
jgi:hypothetical protein